MGVRVYCFFTIARGFGAAWAACLVGAANAVRDVRCEERYQRHVDAQGDGFSRGAGLGDASVTWHRVG